MLKCGKCRKNLIKLSDIITAHGDSVDYSDSKVCNKEIWYVKEESLVNVSWIKDQVDLSNWVGGKLVCPYGCGARLGSFNFVNGFKCNCSKFVVPPIHLIKSKVDVDQNQLIQQRQQGSQDEQQQVDEQQINDKLVNQISLQAPQSDS